MRLQNNLNTQIVPRKQLILHLASKPKILKSMNGVARVWSGLGQGVFSEAIFVTDL